MSTKEKEKAPAEKPASKLKFKTYEEATEAHSSAKEEREVAREEFKTFRKENSIKKDEPPTDEKLLKKYNKLLEMKTKKEGIVDDIAAWLKENKPKKEKKVRETKYEYPADATPGDKKKIRAASRAEAKRALKGETKKDKKKDDKKGKEEKGKGDKKKDSGKTEKKAEKKPEKKEKKEAPAED